MSSYLVHHLTQPHEVIITTNGGEPSLNSQQMWLTRVFFDTVVRHPGASNRLAACTNRKDPQWPHYLVYDAGFNLSRFIISSKCSCRTFSVYLRHILHGTVFATTSVSYICIHNAPCVNRWQIIIIIVYTSIYKYFSFGLGYIAALKVRSQFQHGLRSTSSFSVRLIRLYYW